MHPESLSVGQRRLLALLILLSLLALASSVVIVPYTLIAASYDRKLQRLNVKYETSSAFVQDGEKARNQQRMLERIESANGFFIASDKPALASAELQRRVKLVIEQSGGSVVSSQMMGEKQVDGIEQLVLRVQMRCGVEEIQKVFHTLESQSPILMLDNIYFAARPSVGMVSARDKGTQQQLDVRFDVAGFRKYADPHDVSIEDTKVVSKRVR